jgi:peptidoglycan/LPS O-acetylase OafA/YrhL
MDKKLESIQILRAIAALAVVIFHSHFVIGSFPAEYKVTVPFIGKYGYLGVDLFFVISGFIIAHITSGRPFSILDFTARRFFRIYPIYWAFCLLSFYLYANRGLYFGPKELTLENLLASLAILPIDGSPAYGVGWSLEHEIIFYATTALVLCFGSVRHLAVVIGLLGVAGLAKEVLFASGAVAKTWDFHLISPFNLCFLGGILAHSLRERLSSISPVVAFSASVVVIWTSITLMKSSTPEVRIAARYLGVAISCTLIVMGALNVETASQKALSLIKRAFVEIGNASYSLYLVHWVILINMGRIKYKLMFGVPDWAAELWRYSWIMVCVIIAIAMYHLLEKPLIRLGSAAIRKASLTKPGRRKTSLKIALKP